MKKIYTLASAVIFTASAFAQSQGLYQMSGSIFPVNKTKNLTNQSHLKTSGAGSVSARFDPGFSLLMMNGQADTTNGVSSVNIGVFLSPVYMDSTVQASFSNSTRYISKNKTGMMFDPQSIIYNQQNFAPLFAKNDTWYLDTVWIGGVYKRTSAPNIVDTLVVEITYGDSTLTSNFANLGYPSTSPLSSFGRFITPKVTGSIAVGNKVFLTAAASNYKRIKVPLTEADTTLFNKTSYKPVQVNGTSGLMLTGSNKVGVVFTFVPGAPTASGSVVFAAGTTPQTPQTPGANGFASIIYQQKSPALTDANSIQHYFDDPNTGKNTGIVLYNTTRHSSAASFLQPDLYSSYWIDFTLHGNSTVGINELAFAGVAVLGQNVPNPYTSKSVVPYQLIKEASNVTLTVTDVMGRVISSEIAPSTTGKHSVSLGSYAAGVYYYTLTVDGKSATKKMIVQ